MSARILVVDDSPTIRKVVALILETRSYEPVLAEDGRAALELLQHQNIDLILLDFVMPRMNGYQFCRELRAREKLRNLPVVLMSAKGDKIRGQFGQQTGSVDAITKPFDARGLIAVVEGALKKSKEGRARPAPRADQMLDEDAIAESNPSGVQLSDDPGLRRVQAAQQFGTALAEALVPLLAKRVGISDRDALAKAIQRAATPDLVGQMSALIKALDFGDKQREVLSGDLSVVSIAEVLQLLALQRQSGALSVVTRRAEITLHVRDGNIDFATWKGLRDEFLIGRYLIEDGVLTREELQHVLEHRAGSKRLLGEMLIQLGHATAAQVHTALTRQTSELVYELVRWDRGRFAFLVATKNPISEKASLALPSGALVMEGFRRVDEWRLIEGSFDFDEVLYCDQVAIERISDESKLTRQERRVLSAIDGERTVREIVDAMGGSSFELCKILYQFLNSRLVRRKAA
jgi:DNA-binding response OmpR family regulator